MNPSTPPTYRSAVLTLFNGYLDHFLCRTQVLASPSKRSRRTPYPHQLHLGSFGALTETELQQKAAEGLVPPGTCVGTCKVCGNPIISKICGPGQNSGKAYAACTEREHNSFIWLDGETALESGPTTSVKREIPHSIQIGMVQSSPIISIVLYFLFRVCWCAACCTKVGEGDT